METYFELLQLPMEMQGLKHSIPMGKLKQHPPHGVSPDTDLFLSMFLIRLPPSLREAEGVGNHKTAVAMVRPADALWNACGSHNPTVATVMTLCSKEAQLLLAVRRMTEGMATPVPKVILLPAPISFPFKTLAMACTNFTTSMATKPTMAFSLVPGWKTEAPLNLTSSAAIPAHATATAMHFPANAGLIFLTDELTNDRYLVDSGATLSNVP